MPLICKSIDLIQKNQNGNTTPLRQEKQQTVQLFLSIACTSVQKAHLLSKINFLNTQVNKLPKAALIILASTPFCRSPMKYYHICVHLPLKMTEATSASPELLSTCHQVLNLVSTHLPEKLLNQHSGLNYL